jgi:hypothetical protein
MYNLIMSNAMQYSPYEEANSRLADQGTHPKG